MTSVTQFPCQLRGRALAQSQVYENYFYFSSLRALKKNFAELEGQI